MFLCLAEAANNARVLAEVPAEFLELSKWGDLYMFGRASGVVEVG